jgi:hypothetical protein
MGKLALGLSVICFLYGCLLYLVLNFDKIKKVIYSFRVIPVKINEVAIARIKNYQNLDIFSSGNRKIAA